MFLWFSLLLFLLAELAVRRLLLLTEGEPHESRVPEALWTERTNNVNVMFKLQKKKKKIVTHIFITMINKNYIKDNIISIQMLLIPEFRPKGLIKRKSHF